MQFLWLAEVSTHGATIDMYAGSYGTALKLIGLWKIEDMKCELWVLHNKIY